VTPSKKLLLKALVLAGPVLLFPLARAYYVFYVAILVWGLAEAGLPALWRNNRALRLATCALGLPILATFLAWLLRGELHAEWLEKVGVVALGGLLGLSTAQLASDPGLRSRVGLVLCLVVGSWILDGLLQMFTGHSIDCRDAISACTRDDRISLYWASQAKISYYIGLFVFLPASWLISQGRMRAGLVLLVLGGGVTMAAASRFSMLSWLLGCGAVALVATLRMPRRVRLGVALGLPVLLLLAGGLLYISNPSFENRMDRTAQIFQGDDYNAANKALSGRLDIWGPTLEMLRERWVFGVGPEGLDGAVRPYLGEDNAFANIRIFHAHQVVLDIAAATGLVGLAAFLAFYAWVGREFLRACRDGIDLRWSALLVFLLMWFPLNSPNGFYASEMLLVSFYILGLAFGFRPASGPAPAIGKSAT
jgi:O-antigen ligase